MNRALPFVAAALVVLAGTYLQGKWTERWGASSTEKLERFTRRLDDVPLRVGRWEGTDAEVDAEQFKASHCTGCVSRVYRDADGNDEVSFFLVTGTARHITIHTPDWCYRGAGFSMKGEPIPYTIDCGPDLPPVECLTTTFVKEDALGTQRLRIFWSYTDDGRWSGPVWPKPAFAGRPALYKLYLITTAQDADEGPEASASLRFARETMPILNQVLFPSDQTKETTADAS